MLMTKPKKTKEPDPPQIRHARIELEDVDYERMKKVAKANGLSVSAYIRQAVLQRVRADEES